MRYSYRLSGWREAIPVIRELLPFLIPLAVVGLIVMIAALVNLFKKELAFSDKAIWLVIIIVGQIIGGVIYFAIGSRLLDEKASNREGNME